MNPPYKVGMRGEGGSNCVSSQHFYQKHKFFQFFQSKMKNRPFCLFPAFPASESASMAGYRHYKLLDLRIIIIKNFLFNTVLPLLLAKKNCPWTCSCINLAASFQWLRILSSRIHLNMKISIPWKEVFCLIDYSWLLHHVYLIIHDF